MTDLTLEYLRERNHMTRKRALELIGELEGIIDALRVRSLDARSLVERNGYACQIANRRKQIEWAETFLIQKQTA